MSAPKLLIPAAVLSTSGVGLNTVISVLPQAAPNAPAFVWYGLFGLGLVLSLALPAWGLVAAWTYARGKFRGRKFPTITPAAETSDIQHWRKVDPYQIWQAGCLWGGVKPNYPVTFDNPAYWAFSMLLGAAQHKTLKLVKRVKNEDLAFGHVTQDELRRFAREKGEAPEFLFGNTNATLRVPSTRWRHVGVVAGLIVLIAIVWNIIDFKSTVTVCIPKFEWLAETETGDAGTLKYEIRFANVVPQSPTPYWLSVEADAPGDNLKGLAVIHGDILKDKMRKPWQLGPQGIGARTYYPTGKTGFVIVAVQPGLVKLTPPTFECER